MKCDELQYERLGDANETYPASTLVIRKQFVVAAIDQFKREHHRERDEYIDWVNKLQRENSELKAMVTTDNSAVIARLEEQLRATKRALWIARAAFCGRSVEWLSGIMSHCLVGQIELYKKCEQRKNRYMKAFNKCRAKAEEYK